MQKNKTMRRIILASFAFSLLFISCKDEKKTVEVVEDKAFTFTVNAIVKTDDIFQVFYNEDGSETFAPEESVTINVTGSENPQDLVFNIPADMSPAALRFDIGGNKDLKEVAFKSFKIDYKDKTFTAGGAEFFKYFYPNPQVEFDTVNVVAKIKIIEGQPYDPIIGSTHVLNAEIAKLYPAN